MLVGHYAVEAKLVGPGVLFVVVHVQPMGFQRIEICIGEVHAA